jgi:hypothetical protein
MEKGLHWRILRSWLRVSRFDQRQQYHAEVREWFVNEREFGGRTRQAYRTAVNFDSHICFAANFRAKCNSGQNRSLKLARSYLWANRALYGKMN